MNPMMLVASGGTPITQTFTANATFTVPLSTSRIHSMVGKGAAGSPSSISRASTVSATVEYAATGTGTTGSATWSNAQNAADSNHAAANAGGTVTIQELFIRKYADGTQDDSVSVAVFNDVIPGTASTAYSGGWQGSGAITSSGQAVVSFDYGAPATTGASTTISTGGNVIGAFPGGSGGAASTTTFSNVAVTPGASYNVVVPAGGTLTITYTR